MAPPEYLTHEDAEELIKRTVKETLVSMGVDTSKPLEMQRDFQALRDWRHSFTTMRKWGVMTIVITVTTGIVSALWIGLKYVITK